MVSTTEITSQEIVSDNPIHQRLLFAYLKAVPWIRGNVLEIGCGAGRGLELLIDHADSFTAIDKNKALLQQLQLKYPQVDFIHQHIPPLRNIPSNTFDVVISFQVIEHIHQDDLFVQEIHRVLKKGGKAILTTPNKLLSLSRNPWHVREYTAQELEKLVFPYFTKIEKMGVQGNAKVLNYYQENKKSVERIMRWDLLNAQYWLPRQVLQIPYELLNRFNRRKLYKQNLQLVSDITTEDYFLVQDATNSLDLFYVLTK
ncbi:MAG: class I SAM-dependent methyltransferase [Microscillaceae bacterium]|nr:class I SAM-dependent methyltransferase [Microscillaceae bacterium]MDW8460320.1 class I SAM-dependent methyltransferase [Cytophagales bacterium]